MGARRVAPMMRFARGAGRLEHIGGFDNDRTILANLGVAGGRQAGLSQ